MDTNTLRIFSFCGGGSKVLLFTPYLITKTCNETSNIYENLFFNHKEDVYKEELIPMTGEIWEDISLS